MVYILQCQVKRDRKHDTVAQLFLKIWTKCAISIFSEDGGNNIAVAVKLLVIDLP